MTTNSIERLAQHVEELAAAFKVELVIRHGMNPAESHAITGCEFICTRCGQRNRVTNAIARFKCGKCKAPLGHIIARAVVVTPVIDETTYAVSLHELGHLLDPMGALDREMSRTWTTTGKMGTLRDVRLQLVSETSAWAWAEHHALEWTEVMAHLKEQAIGSYKRNARRFGVRGD